MRETDRPTDGQTDRQTESLSVTERERETEIGSTKDEARSMMCERRAIIIVSTAFQNQIERNTWVTCSCQRNKIVESLRSLHAIACDVAHVHGTLTIA